MTEEYDVYRTQDRAITVDVHGREVTFLYNPDTKYVLVNAGVYGSELDVMQALRKSDLVEGIFNHENITEF